MIQLIRRLLKKEKQHNHDWIYQYETGTHNTQWVSNGKTGYSKSDVFKCECGQMAVKHRSDSSNEFILL